MGNNFNELRWKIIRAKNLLQFIHQVTIEFRFRKSLAQERFKSNFEFRYQIKVSSIKFRKGFSKLNHISFTLKRIPKCSDIDSSVTLKTLLSLCYTCVWYEPVHEISNNVVSATNKASDQPAHTRSLIRAFASRLSVLWLLSYWLNTIWSF